MISSVLMYFYFTSDSVSRVPLPQPVGVMLWPPFVCLFVNRITQKVTCGGKCKERSCPSRCDARGCWVGCKPRLTSWLASTLTDALSLHFQPQLWVEFPEILVTRWTEKIWLGLGLGLAHLLLANNVVAWRRYARYPVPSRPICIL